MRPQRRPGFRGRCVSAIRSRRARCGRPTPAVDNGRERRKGRLDVVDRSRSRIRGGDGGHRRTAGRGPLRRAPAGAVPARHCGPGGRPREPDLRAARTPARGRRVPGPRPRSRRRLGQGRARRPGHRHAVHRARRAPARECGAGAQYLLPPVAGAAPVRGPLAPRRAGGARVVGARLLAGAMGRCCATARSRAAATCMARASAAT